MWVPGSLVYLIPLFVIGVRLLFGDARRAARARELKPVAGANASHAQRHRLAFRSRSSVSPLLGWGRRPFDLLRVPMLGRFLSWRHARVCLQFPLLLLAIVIVFDGFFGPPIAGMNLAGVLPWIHWRGLAGAGTARLAAMSSAWLARSCCRGRLARRLRSATLSWPPLAQKQMAGGRAARRLSVGIRGVRSLGQPLAHRRDRSGLLRAALPDRRSLSRCIVLQICLPDRPVQLRAIADLAAGNQGARPGRVLDRAAPRIASAGATISPAASSASTSRESQATWIARSAWIVFMPARTRTSASSRARRRPSSGTTLAVPASAGSAAASTWPHYGCLGLRRFANAALMTSPLLDLQDRFMSASGSTRLSLATTALCLLALVVLPLDLGSGAGMLSRRWGRLRRPAWNSRRDSLMLLFRWVLGCGWLIIASIS